MSRTPTAVDTAAMEAAEEDKQKSMALEMLLDAWDEAVSSGVDPELVAFSAMFAALTDMVDTYGEEPVADMASALPDRIRRGEFSMRDVETH